MLLISPSRSFNFRYRIEFDDKEFRSASGDPHSSKGSDIEGAAAASSSDSGEDEKGSHKMPLISIDMKGYGYW